MTVGISCRLGAELRELKELDLPESFGLDLRIERYEWEIVEEAAELIKPARDELIREAARGEVLHNDGTSMKVLALRRAIVEEAGRRLIFCQDTTIRLILRCAFRYLAAGSA